MSRRPPALIYSDPVRYHLACLRSAGPKRRTRMLADPAKAMRKTLKRWNESVHPLNRLENTMPRAKVAARDKLTPEQTEAEREVAALLAEVESALDADRAELRALAALPEHDAEQAARFAELAELHKARRRLARDGAARERAAAKRWDKKAENAEWLARQPKGGREVYLMLAHAGYPLTKSERRAADEARRAAREARDAERAAALARLGEQSGAPIVVTPSSTSSPAVDAQPRRNAPRVVFLNPWQ